ncbi:hypothetical protein ACJIZ3_018315 [Penstemon smallii]|uniref:DUF7950 domain-containing protein n=1 Tax=Penstemon smallii TaxID=265156 RepID=A0ABD3SZ73_9LAMI
MNNIMLRFRPIAPKPPGGEAISDSADLERRNGGARNGVKRAKRKYVRVRCRQNKRKTIKSGKSSPPEKSVVEDASPPGSGVVKTLQLLPDHRSESDLSCCNNNIQENSSTEKFTVDYELTADYGGGAVSLNSYRSAIETWIVVECVTDLTVTDVGVWLGLSDREKISQLEVDTCPGFVTDGTNHVVWLNEACRKMVGREVVGDGGGVIVRLVVKENLPLFCPSFACRVRVIQQAKQGQKWNNKIVPCDVWRMEFSGFAWKLDVTTALSLSI